MTARGLAYFPAGRQRPRGGGPSAARRALRTGSEAGPCCTEAYRSSGCGIGRSRGRRRGRGRYGTFMVSCGGCFCRKRSI